MDQIILKISALVFIFILLATGQPMQPANQERKPSLQIKREKFGTTPDGKYISLYTLTNKKGMVAKITNYGGIITELWVPDKNGKIDDIVLGFDSLKDYLTDSQYFGCILGRYANLIDKGKFKLDGVEYKLATNFNGNHLNGGVMGLNKVIWKAAPVPVEDGVGLAMEYKSKDGEEGYPGNLDVMIMYTLTNTNELVIFYEATTDKSTPVNLTQHSYFNLSGGKSDDVLNHVLMIDADKFTVVNKELIPTGKLKSVNGTPMDFKLPHTIGERIGNVEGGYEHNFVLNRKTDSLSLAARVYEPISGRVMEVITTEPGIQFYTGNLLDGTKTGKGSKAYKKNIGFCLETQHFPDSPNHPEFPTTILKPGGRYRQLTIYKFYIK